MEETSPTSVVGVTPSSSEAMMATPTEEGSGGSEDQASQVMQQI